VRTKISRMGIEALFRKPNTSQRHPVHKVYPYLLRHLEITRSIHVWPADITYIPMTRGCVYLFEVPDWASCQMMAWRLSSTLMTDFRMEAVQEALASSGTPGIFNADRGCQFTSQGFTGLRKDHGIHSVWTTQAASRTTCSWNGCGGSVKYEESSGCRSTPVLTYWRRAPGMVCAGCRTSGTAPIPNGLRYAVVGPQIHHGSPPHSKSTARLHLRNGTFCPNNWATSHHRLLLSPCEATLDLAGC